MKIVDLGPSVKYFPEKEENKKNSGVSIYVD